MDIASRVQSYASGEHKSVNQGEILLAEASGRYDWLQGNNRDHELDRQSRSQQSKGAVAYNDDIDAAEGEVDRADPEEKHDRDVDELGQIERRGEHY